jgi:putative endonuclease
MTDPRHELGARAEVAVANWLVRQGWRILDRRWRTPAGELDLVCLDPWGVLVGVEVKLRRTGRAGTAAESLDRRQIGRLRAALAGYATLHTPPHRGIRVDLVTLASAGVGRWRLVRLPDIGAW